jgi:hypothetical protein
MLTLEELDIMRENLQNRLEDMYPPTTEEESGSSSLVNAIALVASQVFTQGIREYEKIKASSSDSVD